MLEDLASSICSDDLKTKEQCSPNQQIKIISFLFGCEIAMNNNISALKSVVSVMENDEPLQVISSQILPKLPLQVACCPVVASPASGPLPSQRAEASSRKNPKKKLRISQSQLNPLSFPNISFSDTFSLLGLGYF